MLSTFYTTMGFPIQTHENNIAHITKAHCGANIKTLGNELYGIDGMYT